MSPTDPTTGTDKLLSYPELVDYRYEEGDPNPPSLEIELRSDNKVLWINFNGVCVFRACNLPENIAVEIKGMLLDTASRVPDKTGWMWIDDDGKPGSIVYDNPASVDNLTQWRKQVEIFIVDEEYANSRTGSEVPEGSEVEK